MYSTIHWVIWGPQLNKNRKMMMVMEDLIVSILCPPKDRNTLANVLEPIKSV
jgi:hypothetical protein